MRKGFRFLGILVVAFSFAPVKAVFADTVYDDPGVWASAVTGSITSMNFQGITGADTFKRIGSGVGTNTTVSGLNFAVGSSSDSSSTLYVLGDGYYYPTSVLSLQHSLVYNDLVITLPVATEALGFTFGDFNGDTATITLSDGTVATPTMIAVSSGSLGFFGVTTYDSGAMITSLEITSPGDVTLPTGGTVFGVLNIGSVFYAVPEPSTLALLGSGLALVSLLAARRTRKVN